MSANRVSIAGMVGLIAVAACCFAAMRSSSPFWTMAATTIGLALLLSAVLGVFLLRGESRAFASGFALFGSVYLILVNWDWIGGQVGHDLTAGLGDFVENTVFPLNRKKQGYFDFETLQQRQFRIGNFLQFARLGFSMMFGFAGGFIARAMFMSSRQSSPSTGHPGASHE